MFFNWICYKYRKAETYSLPLQASAPEGERVPPQLTAQPVGSPSFSPCDGLVSWGHITPTFRTGKSLQSWPHWALSLVRCLTQEEPQLDSESADAWSGPFPHVDVGLFGSFPLATRWWWTVEVCPAGHTRSSLSVSCLHVLIDFLPSLPLHYTQEIWNGLYIYYGILHLPVLVLPVSSA